MDFHANSLTALSPIDQLGDIRAQIADLKEIEKMLLENIKSRGPGKYDGERYSATVGKPSQRELRDEAFKQKVEELIKTHISRQFAVAHTILSEPTVPLYLKARPSR